MFENIISHRGIKNELTRHLENNEISHAYIFSGNEGIGKFAVAREFSKAILCNKDVGYCGVCQSCQLFEAATHPDYKLIEDNKSIKVQEVLEMIEFMLKKPVIGENKVVIFNDSEKMTPGAQNKLLKIFEETPSYGVIILITNNPNLLLDTIKSRGYKIEFNILTEEEIVEFLNERNIGNKVDYGQAAKFSQGSILNAINSLEDDKFINLTSLPKRIFEKIIENDEIQLLRLVSQVSEIKQLLEYLLTWLRDISILKKSRNFKSIYYLNDLTTLQRQSNYFDIEILLKFVDIIEDTKVTVSNHVNPVVSLNYCLLKIQEAYYEHSNRRKV
ncbi:MAG: DNA polymerase III subunit delta' [Clostridiales bacterium]|nr:DNA polymerase III subunit delta' [Clostridiales bacterium]